MGGVVVINLFSRGQSQLSSTDPGRADAISEWMPLLWSKIMNQRSAPTMVGQDIISIAG